MRYNEFSGALYETEMGKEISTTPSVLSCLGILEIFHIFLVPSAVAGFVIE